MTNIGVIGVGTIAYALVEGFCTALDVDLASPLSAGNLHFMLSPRGAIKSAALAETYPDRVTVCQTNQEVIDRSDWVFLTILPRDADEILSPLHFHPEQKILSIMSDHSIEKVREWTGPTAKTIRMVPLPMSALHIGPIAYTPADPEIREMFSPLGQLIELSNQEQLSVISALSAVMSPFYRVLYETSAWGTSQGLPESAAIDYMTSFFEGICVRTRTERDIESVKLLSEEMTPGGLNEMAYNTMEQDDAFASWSRALSEVMKRLKS